MKISVTMSATIRGRSKPVLDFTTIEAEELFQKEALAKAMETFHICGEIDNRWPPNLVDEDGTIIGVIYLVSGKDGAEYRFLLEEKMA